jgi:hypothetical protein
MIVFAFRTACVRLELPFTSAPARSIGATIVSDLFHCTARDHVWSPLINRSLRLNSLSIIRKLQLHPETPSLSSMLTPIVTITPLIMPNSTATRTIMRGWAAYLAQYPMLVRRVLGFKAVRRPLLRKKRTFYPSGDNSDIITAIEMKLDEVTQLRKSVKALRIYVRSHGRGTTLQSLTALLLGLRLTKKSLEASRSHFQMLVSSTVARFLPPLLTNSLVRARQHDSDCATTESLVEAPKKRHCAFARVVRRQASKDIGPSRQQAFPEFAHHEGGRLAEQYLGDHSTEMAREWGGARRDHGSKYARGASGIKLNPDLCSVMQRPL